MRRIIALELEPCVFSTASVALVHECYRRELKLSKVCMKDIYVTSRLENENLF